MKKVKLLKCIYKIIYIIFNSEKYQSEITKLENDNSSNY